MEVTGSSCTCIFIGVIIAVVIYKLVDKLIRWPYISAIPDKYVFITGCDTGFGYEVAKRLDTEGCHVIAGCLTKDGEDRLKVVCSSRLQTVSLDVSQPQSVRRAYERVKEILPPGQGLWGLLNNAGVSKKTGPVEWINIEDYQQVMSVNLYGLIDMTVTFLRLLKKSRGRIVNTSSCLGRIGMPLSTAYSVSKYGVEAFSDCIRRQLSEFGVTVHIIEPGAHKTPILDTVIKDIEDSWTNAPEASKQEYGRNFVDECISTMRKSAENAPDPSGVLFAYEHALLGKFPRVRYVVGMDAHLCIFLQCLPEWLSDFIIRHMSTRLKPTASKIN